MSVDHVVLDASVVAKWMAQPSHEAGYEAAERLKDQVISGEVRAAVPALLHLELINIAARKWGWGEGDLFEMLDLLDELPMVMDEPDPGTVAGWSAQGLTAYDATYVALADELNCTLVTEDRQIARVAPEIALPLAALS